MSWPETADGDVFRRLQASQFDFSLVNEIDFNVDFEIWPPSPEAMRWLKTEYKHVAEFPAEDHFDGYVQLKVIEKLTYELVLFTQDRISTAMSEYGGVCESWGVLQHPQQ